MVVVALVAAAVVVFEFEGCSGVVKFDPGNIGYRYSSRPSRPSGSPIPSIPSNGGVDAVAVVLVGVTEVAGVGG